MAKAKSRKTERWEIDLESARKKASSAADLLRAAQASHRKDLLERACGLLEEARTVARYFSEGTPRKKETGELWKA